VITPIEKYNSIYVKRDDLFIFKNVCGGKVRSALALCKDAKGLVTAGSRYSPQVKIIAEIANDMKIPFHAHIPFGSLTEETQFAIDKGALLFPCKPGFNNAIIGRAKKDAINTGYTYIPFGMECFESIQQTADQVVDIPNGVKRIVVPIGSGMSFLGIAQGLLKLKSTTPLIGIQVGANPISRFNKFNIQYEKYTIIKSSVEYSTKIRAFIDDIELDPIYEAKCLEFLQPGDLLWIVGKR